MTPTVRLRSLVRIILGTLVLGAMACGPAGAQTFSPTDNYSQSWTGRQNPNGPWEYGWSPGLPGPDTSFTLFTDTRGRNGAAQEWYDPNESSRANLSVSFDPDSRDDGNYWYNTNTLLAGGTGPNRTDYAVVRFVAPGAATYSLSASFFGVQRHAPSDIHILVNGIPIYAASITDLGDSAVVQRSLTLKLGETVDFAFGANGAMNGAGSAGLSATFTAGAAPPPSGDEQVEPDEIGLMGVITTANPIGDSFTMDARQVKTGDSPWITLPAPRAKLVQSTTNIALASTGAVGPAQIPALHQGDTIFAVGADPGAGNPLSARLVVVKETAPHSPVPAFDAIAPAQIVQWMSGTPAAFIAAAPGPQNRVPTGATVFYLTKQRRYGKLKVMKYGDPMTVSWVTYAPDGSAFAWGNNQPLNYGTEINLDAGDFSKALDDFSKPIDADLAYADVNGAGHSLAGLNGAVFSVDSPADLAAHEAEKSVAGIVPISRAAVTSALPSAAHVNDRDNTGETALMTSARQGDAARIKTLIALGADVNLRNDDGDTALHLDINPDDTPALIAAKANVNAHDGAGWTPLMYAAEQGRLDRVQMLLAAGADVNARDRSGQTALFKTGNGYVVEALLDAGADPNAVSSTGKPAIMTYLTTGKLKALIAAGVNVNAKQYLGDTPLIAAVRLKNIDAVRMLLAAGADVNTHSIEITYPLAFSTPLSIATNENADDIVAVLRAAGASEQTAVTPDRFSTAQTPLMTCAVAGDLAGVRVQIAAGADVNAVDDYGMTALLYAAGAGQADCVKALLAAGASPNVGISASDMWAMPLLPASHSDLRQLGGMRLAPSASVNAADDFGRTPLMLAANSACDQTLIAAGAKVDARDAYGNTALMLRAADGDPTRIAALLAAGADVDAKRDDGQTPLMCAAASGNPKAIQALIDARADLNAQDDDGDTALTIAARVGCDSAVDALIAAAANLDLATDRGWTALMYTAYRGDLHAVNALLSGGAAAKMASYVGVTAAKAAGANYSADCVGALVKAGSPATAVNARLIDAVDYDYKGIDIARDIPNPHFPRKCPLSSSQITAQYLPPPTFPTPQTQPLAAIRAYSDSPPATFSCSVPSRWQATTLEPIAGQLDQDPLPPTYSYAFSAGFYAHDITALHLTGQTIVGSHGGQMQIDLETLCEYKDQVVLRKAANRPVFNYDCVAGSWMSGAYAKTQAIEPHAGYEMVPVPSKPGIWNLEFIKPGCPYAVHVSVALLPRDAAAYAECVQAVGAVMSTIHISPRLPSLPAASPASSAPGLPAADLLAPETPKLH